MITQEIINREIHGGLVMHHEAGVELRLSGEEMRYLSYCLLGEPHGRRPRNWTDAKKDLANVVTTAETAMRAAAVANPKDYDYELASRKTYPGKGLFSLVLSAEQIDTAHDAIADTYDALAAVREADGLPPQMGDEAWDRNTVGITHDRQAELRQVIAEKIGAGTLLAKAYSHPASDFAEAA